MQITFNFDDLTWCVPDDILNESGDEEACDDIVQGVLDEIGIDISSKVILISLPYKLNTIPLNIPIRLPKHHRRL